VEQVRLRRGRPAALALAVLAIALVALAGGCGDDTEGGSGASSGGGSEESTGGGGTDDSFSGYTRDPRPSVAQVAVPAADGSGDVAMSAPPGGLRIVYFGYTSCPDVCPTTMSDLKRALATLSPEDRERVAFDMITIDPARDVPEKLTDYVTTFIPDGTALRTEDDARLRQIAGAFGADYSVEPAPDGGEPEVSHTAELYVIDDAGTMLLAWPFGTTTDDIAADLQRLVAGERPEPVDDGG
jgi:protein SCO1/2